MKLLPSKLVRCIFLNLIILMIMTSNIGVRDLKDFGAGIGFSTKSKEASADDIMKSTIQNALKKVFSPEFINRLDDLIIFNSLQREHIHEIIGITLKKLFSRIDSLGYSIELTEKAKDFIAEKGFDPQYGARPLNRAIQKYLEDPMAEVLISADIAEGDTISVGFDSKKEEITVKIQKLKKEKKEDG